MDGESREERDARIKALWEQLDTKKKGNVDLPALKNGLVKMNHRESAGRILARAPLNASQRSKTRTTWSKTSCTPQTSIKTAVYPTKVRQSAGTAHQSHGLS